MSTPTAPAKDDLAVEEKDGIQEPPHSLWNAFRQIGPGLILAGSIVGTGELIATTSLGAKNGYSLLWLILLSCVIKVFVQTEMGRYAITRGKTTLAALDSLPGPRFGTSWLSWLWLFMMLTTQSQIAAMEGLVGQAAHMAFPGASKAVADLAGSIQPGWGQALATHPDYFWATLTTLAAILLLLSGGYRRLEKVTTILVAGVTLITVSCVAGLPFTSFPLDGAQMVDGLKFSLPTMGVALAFSAFGITGVGASELFAYPYWCIEKGYARHVGPRDSSDQAAWVHRANGWIKVMHLDAWFSMIVFTVATVAFYLLGAAVLKPQNLDPQGKAMIETLSKMYVGPLGQWTQGVFLIGAWGVLFKTLYVATAGNARLTADFLELTGGWKQTTHQERDKVGHVFHVIYPASALFIYFINPEPKGLVAIGGFAQALMLPLISGATLYLRYRDADDRVGPTKLTDLFTWLAFLGISIVACFSIVTTLMSLAK